VGKKDFFKKPKSKNPKIKKNNQKGMHLKSAGGVNSQGTPLSDTKKSKPRLSAGGVRSGGASRGSGRGFTSMRSAGAWV
jgi:hypothetical protein